MIKDKIAREFERFVYRVNINGFWNEVINLKAYLEKYKVKSSLPESAKELPPRTSRGTSVSDGQSCSSYVEVVSLATQDESVFQSFRKFSGYREILEHLSHHQGVEYLEELSSFQNIDLHELKNILTSVDQINETFRYRYRGLGILSPSLLRYGLIGLDIRNRFGTTFNTVYEVGCGYGGQALVLDKLCNINQYYFDDLPEVTRLIELFTSRADCGMRLIYSNQIPKDQVIDVFISNYAFSELTRDYQTRLLSEVIPRSRQGYMLVNKLGEYNLGSLTYKEILEAIPNSKLLDESPKTSRENALVVWNSDL